MFLILEINKKGVFLLNYIDLKYKPQKTDLVCEFYLEPNNTTIEMLQAMLHLSLL